jgi:putative ABC transport system substrate-binding protein
MRRRDFITLLGGAAVAWPLAAQAQQAGRMRRVGALMGWSEDNPQYRAWLAAFVQGLAHAGWVDRRDVRIDVRWTHADFDKARTFAKELVALQPDVILAGTTPVTAALLRETRTIPIVFAVVSDPVGAGFVGGLARPGGNVTGFINVEAEMGGKWLQLLREVAPRITRAAIMFNPDTAPGGGTYFLGSFEAAARSMMVEPMAAPVHSDAEIESTITSLGQENAGLVVMADSFAGVHRPTIISLAARHRLPAVYPYRFYVADGGLMSYGIDDTEPFRLAAGYVDRILRGEKPADLPVQAPTKYETVVNLKTAKTLGLEIPASVLTRADEVIE